MHGGTDCVGRGGIAVDAAVVDLKEPCQQQGYRETECDRDDDRGHHPSWRAERVEHDVGDLQQQPADHQVAAAHTQHAAPPSAAQQAPGRLFAAAVGSLRLLAAPHGERA